MIVKDLIQKLSALPKGMHGAEVKLRSGDTNAVPIFDIEVEQQEDFFTDSTATTVTLKGEGRP